MLGLGQKLSSVLKHSSVSFREALFHGNRTEQKLGAARNLCMSLQRHRKLQSPQDDDDDIKEINEPIKFSTSRASHRVWSVDRSLGSTDERPWWRVVPLSLLGLCFLLWCVFRNESQIDKKLEKELDDHFPGIFSDEDDTDEDETRPDS